MEEDLVARLAGAAPIGALVGTRVSWFERPRAGGLSALTLAKVYPGREWNHDGPDGLDEPRVQFDSWGATDGAAAALARALRDELETTEPVTVGDTVFHPALLQLEIWSTEDLDGGVKVYRVQQDFTFHHQALA